MEWVETTGKTIEAAKESALDELGVDEQDAEFEILEEPRSGLFGRLRSEGRVRARVRPTAPRAKEDRKDRRRARLKEPRAGQSPDGEANVLTVEQVAPAVGNGRRPSDRNGKRQTQSAQAVAASAESYSEELDGANPSVAEESSAETGRSAVTRGTGRRSNRGTANDRTSDSQAGRRPRAPHSEAHETGSEGEGSTVEVALEEQGRIAEEFLRGLFDAFSLPADVTVSQPDDDNVDLAVTGHDIGMLIGPKGATLMAIQDLTRTVVQRKTGAMNGRLNVDVSGYRRKRSAALASFAQQVAEQVRTTGERKALEPMSSADRKVVHDSLTDTVGVQTLSEGEDPRRRVVIVPAD